MVRKWMTAVSIIMLVGLIAACDNGPSLENTTARQPATVRGTFYTESPENLIFPVKVLFALDCSGSMGNVDSGSDPTNQRLAATMEFVEHYNSNPNVSFEIMLWNLGVFSATRVDGERGFTKDAGEIQAVLSNVVNTSTTDYISTIDAIHEDIRRDILNTNDGEVTSRTKYVIIFFSDGLDNVPGTTEPRGVDIINAVDDLYEMATQDYDAYHFSFHTYLLDGIDMTEQDRQDCIDLMMTMSEHGHGQFHNFHNAQTIDFINITDLRQTVEYQVKFMCAYNFNVLPGIDTLYADSDGDGFSDEQERRPADYWWPATDPNVADTDGDGYSDYFEYRISTVESPHDPTAPDSDCDDQLPNGSYPDSDWDGLNNCEERRLGTNPFHPDTDHDGIPDSVEFYAGTNPLEDQTTRDMDFDGAVDWFEVQRHTNARLNDPKVRARYPYGYDITDRGFDPDLMIGGMVAGMRRYDFTISNISLMDTSGSTLNGQQQLLPGDNLVRVFIAQVPQDRPDDLPVFRVADVIFNYRSATRSIFLYPADFQLLE